MKSLLIKSSNCLLSKSSYGVQINNESIQELIQRNLPEGLKDYRDYPVKITLHVEFLGETELKIETEGYEVSKGENQESEGQE